MGSSSSRLDSQPPVRRSELHRRGLRRQPATDALPTHSHPQQQTRRLRRHSANIGDLLARSRLENEEEFPHQTSDRQSTRNRERISRARMSITSSIPSMFSRRASTFVRQSERRPPSPAPPPLESSVQTSPTSDEDPSSAPQIPEQDLDLEFDLSTWNSNSSSPLESRIPQTTESRPNTLAERLSSFTQDRGLRNLTRPLRRQRSRSQMEEHTLVLSQMLSFAATATAASLVGTNPDAEISELQGAAGGIDNEDGSFRSFLHALREGRLAQALGRDGRLPGNEEDADLEHHGTGSLDFFRMFRFRSINTSRQRSRPQSRRSREDAQSVSSDVPEQRMVPVLIVGIRSLNPETELGPERADDMPSFLEALANAPTGINYPQGTPRVENSSRPQSSGLRSRERERRRASMGALNLFSRPGRSGDASPPYPETGSPVPSESPPGAHPPPTTPYSPSLSTLSSGASTPTGRGPASLPASGLSSRRESLIRRMTGTGTPLEPTAEESTTHPRSTRQRRRSASDTPRFGSGSSRRNGVLMEPAQENRSWIIYVLGGSYPENHPILTTPSLFTDSPTYEDMLLLSSLLGPAKPPVAAVEDLESAPGVFKVRVRNGTCTALSMDGDDVLPFQINERCQICLCNYETGEEGRQLVRCAHIFHRECVDQWLTTGRNSCPLCRSQGVEETKSSESSADEAATATTTAATAATPPQSAATG